MFRNKVLLIIIWLIFAISANCETVVPANNFEPGWIKSGDQLIFYKNDLYGHIDGGAELFLEFGFDKLTVQKYQKGDDEMDLEIYQMTEPASALGIYLLKCGRETPYADVNARNTTNSYQMTIVRGDCFIQINSFSGNDTLVPVMISLAQETLKLIPEADTIDLFDFLPKQDLVKGTERLIRGQYALQPIYTFGAGDIFQLNGEIFGVVGEYKTDSLESYTMIIIPYPDEKKALAAFDNLLKNLDPYLTIIDKSKSGFVFKDYQNLFGDVKIDKNILKVRVNLSNKPIIE